MHSRTRAATNLPALIMAVLAMLVAVGALIAMRDAEARAQRAEALATQAQSWKPRVGQAMLLSQQHLVQAHLGAQAKNWDLASHELDEIEGSLLLASNVIDEADRAVFIEQMRTFVASSLAPLRKASEASDVAAWNDAMNVAVKGCNACHATFDHSYVRVRVPSTEASGLGALDFAPLP